MKVLSVDLQRRRIGLSLKALAAGSAAVRDRRVVHAIACWYPQLAATKPESYWPGSLELEFPVALEM